jgi:hypothetical protein
VTLRRTPLRRTTRLRARGKGAYARRERDVDYMLAVKGLPCALSGVEGAGACAGKVEADHAGERGLGVKAADDTCIPLCSSHHRARTDARGFFAAMSKDERRHWCKVTIARTQLAIAEKRAGLRIIPFAVDESSDAPLRELVDLADIGDDE